MPKQVWQSEDGSIFDTEQKCQEYEKKQALLNDLWLAIDLAREGDDPRRVFEGWAFSEHFFKLFNYLSKEDLIIYKDDFRRLADCIDGKINIEKDQ